MHAVDGGNAAVVEVLVGSGKDLGMGLPDASNGGMTARQLADRRGDKNVQAALAAG